MGSSLLTKRPISENLHPPFGERIHSHIRHLYNERRLELEMNGL